MNNIDNNFETTVFCDESSIWTLRGPNYHHRRKGRYPKCNTIWGRSAQKVHIWGGITWAGAIPFVVNYIFASVNDSCVVFLIKDRFLYISEKI
jgi:hypothetical protein